MGVGQPGMQRSQPDLGAVAEQEENECEIKQRGIELARADDQAGPHHRIRAFADHGPRCHVDENGAEQRERNPDAPQNEIFPRRLQRLMGAVDADHQHRRQGGELDRHPHQADVVRDERKVHREQEELIHRVIEPQMRRRQPAGLDLMRDIGRAEHARGEADERVEHDEDDVEVVDENVGVRRRRDDQQGGRREEGDEGGTDVERGGEPIGRQSGEQRRGRRRQGENDQSGVRRSSHRRSPRNRSSACASTVSNRSLMRNRKTPITTSATSTEKATEISTTSGMPLAPVAARMSPFSSDMKPTTIETAFRLTTIISMPSSTTDSAKARSSRASASALLATRSITTSDNATSARPASMVRPTPTTFSTSR